MEKKRAETMTEYFEDLEIALENREAVKSLRLKKQTRDGLPEEIESFPNLERLDVSRGSYAAFPGPHSAHRGVQSLFASRCCISTVTEEIGEFSSLRELDLSWNEFCELPGSVAKLRQLRTLRIERTPLEGLPDEIGALEELEYLELAGCELSELPESIGKLKNLKVLDLTGSDLEELPESIGGLESLRILRLGGNDLRKLPESTVHLDALVELDLRGNDLEALPEEIGTGHYWRSLQKISLANNDDLDVDRALGAVGALDSLKNLDLSGQPLSPDAELPRGLKELRWRHGDARDLPDSLFELVDLEALDLAFGRLESLDRRLFRLKKLRSLDLTAHSLRSLPSELGALSELKQLFMGSNEIHRLPAAMGGLEGLRELDLSFNPIEKLPPELSTARKLQSVDLENGRIASYDQIGEALSRCENLKRVKLVGNPITLEVEACRKLRDSYRDCHWELQPGKALHRLYYEAKRQLAVGQTEEARQRLERVARFEVARKEGEPEEFTAHRARSDARAILESMG